jgi:hypothetical protein
MKLYPRLARRFARDEFTKQANLGRDELAALADTTHPFLTWPATGAARVLPGELATLRSQLVESARAYGWPNLLTREDQRELDLALARGLWQATELTPAEAGFGDVWSFLALVVVPDVVWWRAAGSTNPERFVGTDLTRHTLARLWWRGHLFTWGLTDQEEGWELWRSSEIGEADLDQIQTRRGGYGRSPKMFRTLVRIYPLVTQLASERGVDRRDLWRQAYLRWVLRLGAFTDFNGIAEEELEQDLGAVARSVLGSVDAAEAPTTVARREDAETVVEFDTVPLASIIVRIAEVVRASGEVADGDLCAALERVQGITIPGTRQEIVRGIAWHASALKYLARDQANSSWQPGPVLPASDRRWGDWTVESFKRYVKGICGDPDVDTLCSELFVGHAGKTVRRLVRAAMDEPSPAASPATGASASSGTPRVRARA